MSSLKNLSVAFLAVFILSVAVVSAQNDLERSSQSDLESLEEIQELLRNVQLIFEMNIASKVREGLGQEVDEDGEKDAVQVDSNGCSCSGLKCSCCKYIRVKKLKIKDNCCLSVTYLPRNYGILVTLKYGSKTLFSKEVSARNPPPLCIGIPFLRKGASICIQFYNLNVGKKTFSGCGRLKASLLFVTVAKINLGCFRMNFLNSTQQVGAVELPYLDGMQAPVEGQEPLYLGEISMEQIKASEYKKN